ncbi:alkylation response protein AidB-like acyl-CoA dehydrogenase [Kitasatospora sp. SolWspMP-SS2h]|uniref:acyl-CoA dehydrogenase family protein n=1 Tax=Kitasatospora sp. SolWspMP-SS2h TaxID=1305729 RepID=UPI000DB9B0EA|nr:acyl-CoA dehydrogenase family protein [Kitasatospora sp. SolWspMP-SS2h]RAJ31792.1 alkylation response protein AidB-like acyl-CoA dehydrogenase [Kitasatospora sp. SolWspMP-SS2h]
MSTPSAVLEDGHRELVEAFESFVRRELVPLAAELPETADLPPADLRSYVRKRSAALGFYAGDYPEELGGSGMPFTAVVLLHHAAGRSGCSLAPYALAGSDGPSPLLRHGTPEQIEKYLVPLVRGTSARCLALTEPQAGSDAFRLTTTAVRDGDGWLISGRKTFVSNADRADLALVVTATDLGEGPSAGATAFVLPMDTPGLRIGQRYEGMSGEPMFELLLERVRVPMDAVIGGAEGVGAATALAMDSLSRGRLVVAAMCNGVAEYALRLGVEHARERRAFGERIGNYQHVQEHLVRSRAEVEAAKLLTLACARLVDEGTEAPENAALAKLTSSETAVRVVDRSLQVHGATGWVRGHPLEFLYRYVRMMTIIEGTSEVQKVIVARAMGLG